MALRGLRLSGSELDGRDARWRARTDEEPMIPHRLPEGVPLHLLEPAERQALADHGGNDWAKACREANRRATFEATTAELEQIRTYGLVMGRKPGELLGEHHVDDALGREVLRELAKKQRG